MSGCDKEIYWLNISMIPSVYQNSRFVPPLYGISVLILSILAPLIILFLYIRKLFFYLKLSTYIRSCWFLVLSMDRSGTHSMEALEDSPVPNISNKTKLTDFVNLRPINSSQQMTQAATYMTTVVQDTIVNLEPTKRYTGRFGSTAVLIVPFAVRPGRFLELKLHSYFI